MTLHTEKGKAKGAARTRASRQGHRVRVADAPFGRWGAKAPPRHAPRDLDSPYLVWRLAITQGRAGLPLPSVEASCRPCSNQSTKENATEVAP